MQEVRCGNHKWKNEFAGVRGGHAKASGAAGTNDPNLPNFPMQMTHEGLDREQRLDTSYRVRTASLRAATGRPLVKRKHWNIAELSQSKS